MNYQSSEMGILQNVWWKQQWDSIISFFKNITTYDLRPKNKLIVYGLAALGISFLATPLIIRPLNLFYRHVIKPRKNFKQRFGSGWAVIAGAIDSLGVSFAHQLALIGYNLILIGDDHDELQQLSKEIDTKYHVQVRTIVFNFEEQIKAADYEKIGSKLDGIDISILINNVGMLKVKPFIKMSAQEILSQIYVNIYSFVFLTRLLIPHMIQRQKRSLVLMVGSGTSRTFTPGYAMFSAAKSCMHNFTKTLDHEYGWKIDFLHHLCGEVVQVERKIEIQQPRRNNEEDEEEENKGEHQDEKKEVTGLDYLVVLPKDAARSILDDAGYVTESHGHIKHLIYNNITSWERVQRTKAKMLYKSIQKSHGENAFVQSAPFSKDLI